MRDVTSNMMTAHWPANVNKEGNLFDILPTQDMRVPRDDRLYEVIVCAYANL